MLLEDWSSILKETGSNVNLARVGKEHGLDKCAVLNPGTNSVSDKTVASLVQAVIGAVHQDADVAAVDAVLSRLGLVHELIKPVILRFIPCPNSIGIVAISSLTSIQGPHQSRCSEPSARFRL